MFLTLREQNLEHIVTSGNSNAPLTYRREWHIVAYLGI